MLFFFFTLALFVLRPSIRTLKVASYAYNLHFLGVQFAEPLESGWFNQFQLRFCVPRIAGEPETRVVSFFFFLNANACAIVEPLQRSPPKASSDRMQTTKASVIWRREQMPRLLHVPLLPPLQPHPRRGEARPSQVIRSSKAGEGGRGGVREERRLSPPSAQGLWRLRMSFSHQRGGRQPEPRLCKVTLCRKAQAPRVGPGFWLGEL